MSISAMKQALQALDLIDKDIEWHDKSPTRKFCNQAAHFLRQAIEQAEKQEPVAWMHTSATGHVYFRKKPQDAVFKPRPVYTAPVHASDISAKRVDETGKDRHEPVAWLDGGLGVFYWACEFKDRPVPPGFEPLYAAYPRYWSNVTDDALIEEVRHRGFTIRDAQISPKREWVGLTKTEFEEAVDGLEDLEDCWQAIEAKLREKNNG